ncbi:hypothetical protein DIE11_10800 [Burkholderia sp. Bp9012]|nr:hypothetical protein DIE11_10800 [Burkholderia sp. Bp9012]
MAIYVREASCLTSCVTRARSAMSTGFIMTTQTIRIRHPHGVRTSRGVVRARLRRTATAPNSQSGSRPASLSSALVAAAPATPRRASRRVVPTGAC